MNTADWDRVADLFVYLLKLYHGSDSSGESRNIQTLQAVLVESLGGGVSVPVGT